MEKKISKINRGAEVTHIDLDLMESVAVEPDVFLNSKTSGGFKIGVPRDIIVLNDSLYLLDQVQNSVLVLDEEGNIRREIDEEGRGPGEVTRPVGMAANKKFIFIYDHGNTRLHMFDRHFKALRYIDASPNPFSRSMSVSDSLLYVYDAISINTGEEKLIKQYEIYPEFKEQKALLPRLLPPGRQPAVINHVEFGTNAIGYLVAGYSSLPQLFLYSSKGELLHSFCFSGIPVDKVNRANKRLKRKHRSDPESTLGLAIFVYSVLLDDDLNIYLFTVDKNLVVLSLKEDTYELAGSYSLEHLEEKGTRARLSISEDRLFLLYENFPEDILVYNLKRLLNGNRQ